MFNLIDIIVIAVICLSAFVGLKKGFVKTLVGLVAFFVAVGVALLFYKPVAVILTENTQIDDWIIENINKIGDEEQEETKANADVFSGDVSIENIFKELPNVISEKVGLEETKTKAKADVAKNVSELIMKLLSLIIIYFVIRVTIFIATIILSGITNLPILKQLNALLGLLLGILIGLAQLYMVFAIFTFVSGITDITFVTQAIKSSLIAKYFYEYNIIISLLF